MTTTRSVVHPASGPEATRSVAMVNRTERVRTPETVAESRGLSITTGSAGIWTGAGRGAP